jgi:proline dehydrogenase
LARTLLLKASDSTWLRQHGTRAPFVRRAVSRFMPGETFDDMLGAARAMADIRIGAVFTRLGENVTDRREADAVAAHYLEGIARIRTLGLAAEPSIKLTQLGLDIDREFAFAHARTLATACRDAGSYLWIDMEQSAYVDVTLEIVRRLRDEGSGIGVCLQAYLLRTRDDLADMIARHIGVRLVKGAYNEAPAIVYARKSDVDGNYLALARVMLTAGRAGGDATGGRAVFGTHDTALISAILASADEGGGAPAACEFHMLYGIQRAEQLRLVAAGRSVRVLIAYGEYWFPWYMRRLAERPANVWFVVKSLAK